MCSSGFHYKHLETNHIFLFIFVSWKVEAVGRSLTCTFAKRFLCSPKTHFTASHLRSPWMSMSASMWAWAYWQKSAVLYQLVFIFLSQFGSPCPEHVNSPTLMFNPGHHKTITQRIGLGLEGRQATPSTVRSPIWDIRSMIFFFHPHSQW